MLTRNLSTAGSFTDDLTVYFTCEALSRDDCDRDVFERLGSETGVSVIYAMVGVWPLVTLLYVVSPKELKERFSGGSSYAEK